MAATIVRVLVLDATAARRARLERLLQGEPSFVVVGGAGSAQEAAEVARRRQPEVILLGLAGAAAQATGWVRDIMNAWPLPIVAVAAERPEAVAQRAFALLEAGALAVLREPEPPDGAVRSAELAALLQHLRLMAEVRVVRRWTHAAGPHAASPALPLPARPRPRPRTAPAPLQLPAAPPAAAAARKTARVQVVAIGASTGGPVTLKRVLCSLPASFPVPILIVQHIADGFVDGLASWLSAACAIPTEVARTGVKAEAGRAYLAPNGVHMRLAADGRLELDAGPPVNGHRPAVSCLFASIAAHCPASAIAILLTGMGRDGAAELKMLKDGGAITIAQDHASSVIHGMPGEAIRCGGATYVMSPEEIAAALPALAAK